MEHKKVMAFDIENFNTKITSIEDAKKDINSIDVISLSENEVINDTEILYTSKDIPLTYTGDAFFTASNCLNIDLDYYLEHKEEINNLINYISANKNKKICINSKELITEEIIDTLIQNPNLEEVTLGNRSNPYKLDLKTYEKFKNSHIKVVHTHDVEEELKTIFDGKIGYNYECSVLDYLSLYELSTKEELSFLSAISNEEMDNLKYVRDDTNISVHDNNFSNILSILKTLKQYNKNNLIKITFSEKDKNRFNQILFNNFDLFQTSNITINCYGLGEYPLEEYSNYEQRLYKLIEPAINLSPLERYLYAYNVVKKFKKYQENEDDKQASRNLYQILDNEYMVCVGYSHLLSDLLDKLNIPNSNYSVNVDITYDKVPLDTHIVTEDMLLPFDNGGHARLQVNLVDPKYNINGYFIADPTWDNDMEHDAYNHALMTHNEYNGIRRYNYLNFIGVQELFFVNNLEEFYQKVNIWMNKQISLYNGKNVESKCINDLMNEIEELDLSFYQNCVKKYPKISTGFSEYTKEEISNIITDLGVYIVTKVNNMVTGLQLKDAITVLYEECYGLKDSDLLHAKIDEIIKYNQERQLLSSKIE